MAAVAPLRVAIAPTDEVAPILSYASPTFTRYISKEALTIRTLNALPDALTVDVRIEISVTLNAVWLRSNNSIDKYSVPVRKCNNRLQSN